MLKKFAAAAAIAGLGFVAAPAHAELVCVDVYLDLNGTVVAQTVCTPA
jgi:hypothetical protein